MVLALLWGLIAVSSVVLGGLLTLRIKTGSKSLGLIMAFGAGVLISAVAYELAHEAMEPDNGTGMAGLGLSAVAFAFFIGDAIIDQLGRYRDNGQIWDCRVLIRPSMNLA